MPQGDAVLPVEKGHVAVKIEKLPADGLLGHAQPFDDASFQQFMPGDLLHRAVQNTIQQRNAFQDVRRENLMHQAPIDRLVHDRHLAGHDDPHDWLPAAPAGAARLPQQNVTPPRGGNVLLKLVEHVQGAGGVLAGGRADLNENPAATGAVLDGSLGPSRKLLETLHYQIV